MITRKVLLTVEKRHNIYIVLLVMLLLFITGCANIKKVSFEDTFIERQEKEEPLMEDEIIEQNEPVQTVEEITISAIGDILIHSRVYDDAKEGKGYNFLPMLEHVKNYLGDTTITFANQETMIGGTEIGLSTYPAFNSPTEVGDALKAMGVNIVSLANNHTLDRGEKAIQHAIQHWEKIDMMYVGAYKNTEDQSRLRVMETEEGISVAFLAYTYGTNGIPVPDGKDYLVNLIDKEQIDLDMKIAKEYADVVIVSLHFGNEYERMPSEGQKELAQFVADRGANVILGHHPHVLQPVEWLTGKERNKTFVAYSLGNFLSGQDKLYRQIGGVLKLSITKTTIDDEIEIEVHSPLFLPTYNASNNEKNYRVLPMHALTNDILPNAQQHYEEIKTHMSQWMPELRFITD